MILFHKWVKDSGYIITNRGNFRKGSIEFTIDELAEIFSKQL